MVLDDFDDDLGLVFPMVSGPKLPKMLMNRVAVRALGLILCRLRAMLQGYLFKHFSRPQELPKISLKQFFKLS